MALQRCLKVRSAAVRNSVSAAPSNVRSKRSTSRSEARGGGGRAAVAVMAVLNALRQRSCALAVFACGSLHASSANADELCRDSEGLDMRSVCLDTTAQYKHDRSARDVFSGGIAGIDRDRDRDVS